MVKREFTAQIIGDFKSRWLEQTAKDERITIDEAIKAYAGPELDKLHDRISGNRVTLTENVYRNGETDYFEKEDKNFVIHRNLFAEVN